MGLLFLVNKNKELHTELHKNSEILVLDEPTSALDKNSENEISENNHEFKG